MEWRCQCGEVFPEDGTGKALGEMRLHVMKAGQRDGRGKHRCLGLWDHNGVQVVSGPSEKSAVTQGYIQPHSERMKKSLAKEQAVKAATSGGASLSRAGNILGVIPFARVVLPPQLEFYFQLHRRTLVNDWTDDDAGRAAWIGDIIDAFTRDHLDYFFGIHAEEGSSAQAKREWALELLRQVGIRSGPPERLESPSEPKLVASTTTEEAPR